MTGRQPTMQDDRLYQTDNPFIWRFIMRNLSLLAFLALSIGGMFAVYFYFSPVGLEQAEAAVRDPSGVLSAPIFKPAAGRTVSQRFTQTAGPLQIGIISGHMNNDSGAVCDDGLTEAQVNLDIALRTADILRAAGVRVTILAEFDPRLPTFSGDALVSIHADSCTYVNDVATGFKISPSPLADSTALFDCLHDEYAAATGLPFHANTITPDMADYHAFRDIRIGLPAAIIEVGFMNLDREILTTGAAAPAEGIASGVLCFLGVPNE